MRASCGLLSTSGHDDKFGQQVGGDFIEGMELGVCRSQLALHTGTRLCGSETSLTPQISCRQRVATCACLGFSLLVCSWKTPWKRCRVVRVQHPAGASRSGVRAPALVPLSRSRLSRPDARPLSLAEAGRDLPPAAACPRVTVARENVESPPGSPEATCGARAVPTGRTRESSCERQRVRERGQTETRLETWRVETTDIGHRMTTERHR